MQQFKKPSSVCIILFEQNYGVFEPAAVPRDQRQSDGEPGESMAQYLSKSSALWVGEPCLVPCCCSVLQTGIWTELYKIEDNFLKPLRLGVNMSRAHYEQELRNTMETKRSKTKGRHWMSPLVSLCISISMQLYIFFVTFIIMLTYPPTPNTYIQYIQTM